MSSMKLASRLKTDQGTWLYIYNFSNLKHLKSNKACELSTFHKDGMTRKLTCKYKYPVPDKINTINQTSNREADLTFF